MGVEYRRYLLPRPNFFRPTPEALANLVDALRQERWILAPSAPERATLPFATMTYYAHARNTGFYVRQDETYESGPAENLGAFLAARKNTDLLLAWPVESLAASGLRYPLESPPSDGEDVYFEIQLHLSRDYAYHCSEVVDPFDEPPVCACGTNLEYQPDYEQDPFGAARISAECPECGAPFNPTKLPCTVRDPWTGDEQTLPGGLTYRFAVVIDCGKCFGEAGMSFAADLKHLVESTLGVATYEVEDVY